MGPGEMILDVSCVPGAWEEAERAADRILGRKILLTTSWTLLRSLSVSYGGTLPTHPPHMALVTLRVLCASSYPTPQL